MKKRSEIREYWNLIDSQYEIVTEVSELEANKPEEELDGHDKYASLKENLDGVESEIDELRSEFESEDFDHLLVECFE